MTPNRPLSPHVKVSPVSKLWRVTWSDGYTVAVTAKAIRDALEAAYLHRCAEEEEAAIKAGKAVPVVNPAPSIVAALLIQYR